jgi:hypothetical protein
LPRCCTIRDCSLEVSTYPEDPAAGHLDTSFLHFPLSLSKFWDSFKFPSCYSKCHVTSNKAPHS